MKKIILFTLIIIILKFNTANAIEPPAILKDHIEDKKLSQTTIEKLKHKINKNQNNIDAYNDLIKLQIKLGLTKDAVETYLQLAIIYENSNMLDQAKLCYKGALKLDPESEHLLKKVNTVEGIILPEKTNLENINMKKPDTNPYYVKCYDPVLKTEVIRLNGSGKPLGTKHPGPKYFYNYKTQQLIEIPDKSENINNNAPVR